MSIVVKLSLPWIPLVGRDLYLDMTKIYMAGVVDEAEDADPSGAPGLILLYFFKSFHVNLSFVRFLPLVLSILSSDYDYVDASVTFVYISLYCFI